jgi:hypothetical protein
MRVSIAMPAGELVDLPIGSLLLLSPGGFFVENDGRHHYWVQPTAGTLRVLKRFSLLCQFPVRSFFLLSRR